MSLNEPLDLKREPKGRRSEPERTAKKHATNKRQKSKRAASPTSSCLSMRTDWSIDPPTNFKDGDTFPLHSSDRIKRRRETSPVTSYISLKSDNPMNVSKASESDLRAASPTPTYLSLGTDWSIDPPTNFKTADKFPLDPRLLTEQHLRCPVCKSLLKDPVSIPCGHNYCSGCINAFWDTCAGEYVCPHCGKASETRPVLNTNAALAEVVKNIQQAGFSPALPPQSYAGPEDVACDLCSERRLKSVKSCSTCGVSLCETHVRQHYTVPALQKHTLCDVTGDTKTRPSQQQENTDNSFNSSASGQQHHADKTQDIIKCPEFSDTATPVTDEPEPTTIIAAVRKETESGIVPEPKDESNQEMAVATKLQTRLKRSAKTLRPKTKEKKENIKSLALICSTLQQEMSGLREKLSELESKNTKKEKYEDEEDYGEEYDKEEDELEEDDDSGEEDIEEYEEGDDDYGIEDEEEYDEEEEKDDGDDSEDYSEKDFDAENDEEESDEHSFDDEDGYKDDYEEEDDWQDDKDVEDYYDEDNSEDDSDKDSYDSNYY